MIKTNRCLQMLTMAIQAGLAFLIGAAGAAVFCSWVWSASWM